LRITTVVPHRMADRTWKSGIPPICRTSTNEIAGSE
jgi:hypothetical protein